MGREESIPSASTNAVRVLYLGVGDSIQVPVPVLRYEVVRYKKFPVLYPVAGYSLQVLFGHARLTVRRGGEFIWLLMRGRALR